MLYIPRSTSTQIPDVSINETVSNDGAKQLDFQFFRYINESQEGDAAQPKSKVRHLPLIDSTPTEPSTIIAAMFKVTEKTGEPCSFHCRPAIMQGGCKFCCGKPGSFQYILSNTWGHASIHKLCEMHR